MVRSLDFFSTVKRASEFGVVVKDEVRLDWSRVIARKQHAVEHAEGDKAADLRNRGIDYYKEKVTFISPEEVTIGSERARPKRIIIATGSKPSMPPIPGVEHTMISDDALEIKELPTLMVIIGGGFIALEFAHVFHQAGVKVTILEAKDRLLSTADGEISKAIKDSFIRQGIEVYTGAGVSGIEAQNGTRVVTATIAGEEKLFTSDVVLNATGRVPSLDTLSLDAVGILYSKKGIKVNEFMQTNIEHVYAAGDVTGGYMLTPVASYEARVAAQNAVTGNSRKIDYRVVPYAVFSRPEIGSVGLTEEEAQARGIDYSLAWLDFATVGAAVVNGETEGFVKLVVDNSDNQIIGGHIIGHSAAELILEVAIAMKGNLTVDDIADTIYIHPTFSEAVAGAAVSHEKGHFEACCG
ncbi:MAG: NAD(P)/FAD-dependent oxidoreductase [Actinobacteria bacterium]|nr:NAD(P)/FAD-dependent oxidoreductase [Actinomycetota bacterium]